MHFNISFFYLLNSFSSYNAIEYVINNYIAINNEKEYFTSSKSDLFFYDSSQI